MESIGRLTGGIAHDFNNLLTVIEGSAEIIADDAAATPVQRKLARAVFAAAERGAELTRSMLAFARRQPLEPKIIDVNRVMSGMETMLRRVLGEDVDIRFRRTDGLWRALADSGQLENAVLNLAINARYAMPGGGMLTIETENATLDDDYVAGNADVRPGDYVMLAVSDTGTGMTRDILERAFEPYFTTKPVGQGTGLGLSMVFGFVKQSGGHIKAYSEVGHGTTIRIYLPRTVASEVEELRARRDDEVIPSGTEAILVVEDDELVRAHVEGQLRGLGYAVLAVPEGASALKVLAEGHHADLLFTDVIMPGGLNGRDLAAQARQLRPGLKVLFMSGYAENALTHHGRLEPGVHLLNKPFRRLELAMKVREVLDG
jgi:CheY-like chemotaxis protein